MSVNIGDYMSGHLRRNARYVDDALTGAGVHSRLAPRPQETINNCVHHADGSHGTILVSM